jgi:hypothetical protein
MKFALAFLAAVGSCQAAKLNLDVQSNGDYTLSYGSIALKSAATMVGVS